MSADVENMLRRQIADLRAELARVGPLEAACLRLAESRPGRHRTEAAERVIELVSVNDNATASTVASSAL